MTPNLSLTKLQPPMGLLKSALPRPRLFQAPGASSRARIIILCAPAGYGKTISALQSLFPSGTVPAEIEPPVVWISAKPPHNRKESFWPALLTAMEPLLAKESFGQLQVLLTSNPGKATPAIIALCNALFAGGVKAHLVMDDFHHLPEEVLSEMEMLLDHLPAAVTCWILSREQPAISLSRFRLTGELQLIGPDHLGFNEKEALSLLSQGVPGLDEHRKRSILRMVQGWPAGIMMIVQALQDLPDPNRYTEHLVGKQQQFAAYLLEEVLASLPPPLKRFMIETSLFGELTLTRVKGLLEVMMSRWI